jgi:hypothetical protein
LGTVQERRILMTTRQSYENWVGTDAYDPNGDKIGEITDIFYDEVTKRPEWVAVKTGFFGMKTTLVPILSSHTDSQGHLVLNYSKQQVKDAPSFDPDYSSLTKEAERNLWTHFGYDWSTRDRDFGYGQVYREPRADKDFHYDAPSMSERMRESQGGRTERKADDVRLTRYVVTETKNVEVPVSREEIRVERD